MTTIIEWLRVVSMLVVVGSGWAPVGGLVGGVDLVAANLGISVDVELGDEAPLGVAPADDEPLDQGRPTTRAGNRDSLADALDEELLDQRPAPTADDDDEPLDRGPLSDLLDDESLDAGLPPLAPGGGIRAESAEGGVTGIPSGDGGRATDANRADNSGTSASDDSRTSGGGGGGGGGRATERGSTDDGGTDRAGGGTDGAVPERNGGGGGSVLVGNPPDDLSGFAGCHVVAVAGRAQVRIGCDDGGGVFAGFAEPTDAASSSGGSGDSAGGGTSGGTRRGGSGSTEGTVSEGDTAVEEVNIDLEASGGREREDDRGRNGQGGRTTTDGDAGSIETGDLPESVRSPQTAPDVNQPRRRDPRYSRPDRLSTPDSVPAADAPPAPRPAGEVELGAPAANVAFDAPPLRGIGLESLAITPEFAGGTRYDDPALRYLPELVAAADAQGLPPALLATLVRITSAGEPAAVFPDGGIGLAKVPAPQFVARQLEPTTWFDPSTNLDVAAEMLADYLAQSGSPELALAAYLAETGYCNPAGACVPGYGEDWYDYYDAALADPAATGLRTADQPDADTFSPQAKASLAELTAPPLAADSAARTPRSRSTEQRRARQERADRLVAAQPADATAAPPPTTDSNQEPAPSRSTSPTIAGVELEPITDERRADEDQPPLAAALIEGLTDTQDPSAATDDRAPRQRPDGDQPPTNRDRQSSQQEPPKEPDPDAESTEQETDPDRREGGRTPRG